MILFTGMRLDRNSQVKGTDREDGGPEHSLGTTQHLETEQKRRLQGAGKEMGENQENTMFQKPREEKHFRKNGLTDLAEWC